MLFIYLFIYFLILILIMCLGARLIHIFCGQSVFETWLGDRFL